MGSCIHPGEGKYGLGFAYQKTITEGFSTAFLRQRGGGKQKQYGNYCNFCAHCMRGSGLCWAMVYVYSDSLGKYIFVSQNLLLHTGMRFIVV